MLRFLQTFSSPVSAVPTRKSGLIIELQQIERQLKTAKSTEIRNDHPIFKRFIDTLDCVLIDGLKDIRAAYWPAVHTLLCKSTLVELCSLRNVKTSLGRSRAWLFRGFNDQLLSSYLNCLLDNRKVIEQFYNRDAVLYSKINLLEVINIVLAVEREAYAFQLEVDCAYFDNVNWLHDDAIEAAAEAVGRDAVEAADVKEQLEFHSSLTEQQVAYHADNLIKPQLPTRSGSCLVPEASENSGGQLSDAVCSLDDARDSGAQSETTSAILSQESNCNSVPITASTVGASGAEQAGSRQPSICTNSTTSMERMRTQSDGAQLNLEVEASGASRDQFSITSSDIVSSLDDHGDLACVTTVKSRVRGVRNRKQRDSELADASTPSQSVATQSHSSIPFDTLENRTEEFTSDTFRDKLELSSQEPQSELLGDFVVQQPALDKILLTVSADVGVDVEVEAAANADADVDAQKDETLTYTTFDTFADIEEGSLITQDSESATADDAPAADSKQEVVEPVESSNSSAAQSDRVLPSDQESPALASYESELPHEAKLFLELTVFAQNERCERVFNVLSSFVDGDMQPSWLVLTNKHIMTIEKLHRGFPVDFSNRRSVTFSSLPLSDVQSINFGLQEQWFTVLTKRRRVAIMLDTASRALTAAIATTLCSMQPSIQCYSDASVYELVLRKYVCRDSECQSVVLQDPAMQGCQILACNLCFLTQLAAPVNSDARRGPNQNDSATNMNGNLQWRKFYIDANQAADVRSGGSSVWNALAYSQSIMQGAFDSVRQNPATIVRSLKTGFSGTLNSLRRLAVPGTERTKPSKTESPRTSSLLSDASSEASDFTPIEQDWNSGFFLLEDGVLSQFASESAAKADYSYSVAEECIGCQIDTQSDDSDYVGESRANARFTCLLLFRNETGPLVDDSRRNNGQIVCLEIRINGGHSDTIREWHAACCRTVLAGQSGQQDTRQRTTSTVQRNSTACALVVTAHCDGVLRMHFLRGNRVLHDYRSLADVELNGTDVETALTTVGSEHMLISQIGISSDASGQNPMSIVSFLDRAEFARLVRALREYKVKDAHRQVHLSSLDRVNQDSLADIHPALSLDTIHLIVEHMKKYAIVS